MTYDVRRMKNDELRIKNDELRIKNDMNSQQLIANS